MKRALVVYNPVAGARAGEAVATAAANRLRARGCDVRLVATRDRGGALDVVREELDSEPDLLVVAGGDGTLREAIEGLGCERERVVLAVLPLGNANVVARELGIPLAPEAAIDLLERGRPTSVDLGVARAEGFRTLFLAVVGVGFDARVVERIDRLRRTPLGARWYRGWADSAYFVCGLLASLRRPRPHLSVVVDGEPLPERYCGLHLSNGATYAKGMSVTPGADIASRRIHYQARKRRGLVALLWHLLAAALRRPVPRWISRSGAGRAFRVESSRAVELQIDGDYRGLVRAFEVEVRPEAARILAPPGPESPH